MYILGIESSCDETAVSLIERGEKNRILNEQIKSQIPIHREFGGVVPELASRNHYEVIDRLTADALSLANIRMDDISLIAFTQGPGLIGSLLIGLSFAKALSFRYKIPLMPVDHIQGHIQAAFIENPKIQYPLIALVVSGGHTTIFLKRNLLDCQIISKTRDDAAGEVMDKTAKFFGLGYPGGPVLDKFYPRGNPSSFSFTTPRMSDGSFDFSFSGYKTAVINLARKHNIQKDTPAFFNLNSSFLNSITNYLLKRTTQAAKENEVKSIIVSGGVSRNTILRKKFQDYYREEETKIYLPSLQYCTDNASMIAWLGYEKLTAAPDQNLFDYSLNVYSRMAPNSSKKHR
jgi:N6-L-threonylcarbamoyladenine synthase